MTYYDELCRAMQMLAERPNAIFLGQGVGCEGTTMAPTFRDVAPEKRLEMPVAEELQMGMAIGLSLDGWLPICVFPRWNFVLRAADQIVNHLDRLPLYSGGEFKPKVIIRTAVPSTEPFNPQAQHDDNFSNAFRTMFRTVTVLELREPEDVRQGYEWALEHDGSSVLVEFTHNYRNARADH